MKTTNKTAMQQCAEFLERVCEGIRRGKEICLLQNTEQFVSDIEHGGARREITEIRRIYDKIDKAQQQCAPGYPDIKTVLTEHEMLFIAVCEAEKIRFTMYVREKLMREAQEVRVQRGIFIAALLDMLTKTVLVDGVPVDVVLEWVSQEYHRNAASVEILKAKIKGESTTIN